MFDKSKKLKDMTFVALDLETTGAFPIFDKIVEIGAASFTLDGVIEKFETLVNPHQLIPPNVEAIHTISNEMVQSAPHIDEVMPDLLKLIDGNILIIHNPSFDLSFINLAIAGENRKPPKLYAFDTVKLSRKILPDIENHKLSSVCDYFDIDLNHHRAMSDTLGCMDSFVNLLSVVDPEQEWTLRDLLDFHGNLITTKVKRGMESGSKLKGVVLGVKVRIDYLDGYGEETFRTIMPMEFVRFGKKKYLFAYCHLREENRFFLTSRITGYHLL